MYLDEKESDVLNQLNCGLVVLMEGKRRFAVGVIQSTDDPISFQLSKTISAVWINTVI